MVANDGRWIGVRAPIQFPRAEADSSLMWMAYVLLMTSPKVDNSSVPAASMIPYARSTRPPPRVSCEIESVAT